MRWVLAWSFVETTIPRHRYIKLGVLQQNFRSSLPRLSFTMSLEELEQTTLPHENSACDYASLLKIGLLIRQRTTDCLLEHGRLKLDEGFNSVAPSQGAFIISELHLFCNTCLLFVGLFGVIEPELTFQITITHIVEEASFHMSTELLDLCSARSKSISILSNVLDCIQADILRTNRR